MRIRKVVHYPQKVVSSSPPDPQSHVTLAARGTFYENLNYSIGSADKFHGKANVSRIEYLCDFLSTYTREFESPKVSIVSVLCRGTCLRSQ